MGLMFCSITVNEDNRTFSGDFERCVEHLQFAPVRNTLAPVGANAERFRSPSLSTYLRER